MLQRARGAPRRLEVRRIEPLSPRMVRIRFSGPGVRGLEWRGPAAHLKLIVPADGSHEVEMPQPDGPRSPFMRTYTPRHIDSATGEIDIDFVLHGDGPASRWAQRAQIGDRLVMMGPAPGFAVDESAAWYLLVGDDSALPALETLLEAMPAQAVATVLVEVPDEREVRALPRATANTKMQWLARGENARLAGSALEAAVRDLGELPTGAGRIYVGCEAGAVRRIRELLLAKPGIEKRAITARGYWRLDNSNHPDRDFVEDPE